MPYLMIRHLANGFDNWRSAFDAEASQRVEAGLGGGYVLRDLENDCNVTVMLEFEYDRLESVRAFANQMDGTNHSQAFILDDAEEIGAEGMT